MSLAKRKEKLGSVIKIVIDSYFVADQYLQMLLPLLNKKPLYSVWDYTDGVQGVSALRLVLYRQIIADMYALLFDTSSSNVASIANILPALRDESFLNVLKEDFCEFKGVTLLGDHSEEEREYLTNTFKLRDYQWKSQLFDETLTRLETTHSQLEGSELSQRIRNARSKIISHKEITTTENERRLFNAEDFELKFSDAKDIVEASREIIFDVNLLITNSSYSLDTFLEYHENVASIFWSKLQA